jgi:lipoprotein-anchoring transpeptidase ErfK/SrfK
MKKNLLPVVIVLAMLAGGGAFFLIPNSKKSEPATHKAVPVAIAALPSSSAAAVIQPPAPPSESAAFKQMLSKTPDAHSAIYEVKSGDNLTAISKKYSVTIDTIKKINSLPDDKIRPGMKLKIPTYKLSLVVDKSQNSLILKGDEEVLKTYTVSTGMGNITPTGVFKITDKVVNPVWYKNNRVIPFGSPENLLGTRWLGLNQKGYGIHGTTDPDKLGQQVTEGCVRMRNEEVEELFSLLPSGTEVTIVD